MADEKKEGVMCMSKHSWTEKDQEDHKKFISALDQAWRLLDEEFEREDKRLKNRNIFERVRDSIKNFLSSI